MPKRPPHPDNDLIDEQTGLPTPSQGGSSGGNIAPNVGERDELKQAMGGDPEPTQVNKSDKPAKGDMPTPPNRAPS